MKFLATLEKKNSRHFITYNCLAGNFFFRLLATFFLVVEFSIFILLIYVLCINYVWGDPFWAEAVVAEA